MDRQTKKRLYIGMMILAAVLVCGFIWYSFGLYQHKKETELSLKNGPSFQAASILEKNVIEFQGKTYERNPSIKAIMLLGVDTSGDMETKVSAGAGQADSIYLAAFNAANDTIKLLSIPRDTMTPITLTDLSGNVLGKDTQHINLAYAYGDGRELSCERTGDAVTELLGGLPIDGYLAMNTSMISDMNDLVGGVTVTVQVDGMERRDPALTKGTTLTLSGKQAEIFVRFRDINIDNSALTRMSQQTQYMQEYMKQVKKQASRDDHTIVRIMNAIETQMVTNMNKSQYMEMGTAVLNSSQELTGNDILTIPGEPYYGEFFDEFHHDPEGTQRIVLELFYREK